MCVLVLCVGDVFSCRNWLLVGLKCIKLLLVVVISMLLFGVVVSVWM